MAETTAFNARLISSSKIDIMYRVYVRGPEIIFVELSNQAQEAMRSLLLIVAVAVPAALLLFYLYTHTDIYQPIIVLLLLIAIVVRFSLFKKKRGLSKYYKLDQQDPALLASSSENSFTATLAELNNPRIEPVSILSFQHRQHGRWEFSLRNGSELTFQFEDVEEMKSAIAILRKALGRSLAVNVQWNEKKRIFTAKS